MIIKINFKIRRSSEVLKNDFLKAMIIYLIERSIDVNDDAYLFDSRKKSEVNCVRTLHGSYNTYIQPDLLHTNLILLLTYGH